MDRVVTKYEVYQNVGLKIKRFAYSKFGSVKALAERLGTSPSQLSQYIHGTRLPGRKICMKLISLGLTKEILDFYDNIGQDIESKNYTYEELIMLIKRKDKMISQQYELIEWYEKRLQIHVKEQAEINKEEGKRRRMLSSLLNDPKRN